ncbi:DUF819 family protein [Vibrio sp.]|nr:DUF819 family protein [Vibrio sp.]
MITNDAVILGILTLMLAVILKTSQSSSRFFLRFYNFVPNILLCYFIPSFFNSVGLIDTTNSEIYYVTTHYFLPVALVLFILSTDVREFAKLGPKPIIMFASSVVGVVIGGPISLLLLDWLRPDLIEGDTWKALTAISASWVGGTPNQSAMKEIFDIRDGLYISMVTVDVLFASIWMAIILILSNKQKRVDTWLKSDTSSIESLKVSMTDNETKNAKPLKKEDLVTLMGAGFGITGLAHFCADLAIPWLITHAPFVAKYGLTSNFLWVAVLTTSFSFFISRFEFCRSAERAGASKIGSVIIYILVATIGLQVDIVGIFRYGDYLLIGLIWIVFVALWLLIIAKSIKAPLFYVAVGSQASIGGAASAPVVAAIFHPSLAPIGILFAVIGYACGNYAGYISGMIMQFASSM